MIIKTNLNDQGCPVVVTSFQDLLKKMMELNAEVVSMTVSKTVRKTSPAAGITSPLCRSGLGLTKNGSRLTSS